MEAPAWKQDMDQSRLRSLANLFKGPKPVVGMVQLWPLPGAPGYSGYGMRTIIDHSLRDAEELVKGGVDGLIVENMWDLRTTWVTRSSRSRLLRTRWRRRRWSSASTCRWAST